MISLLSYGPVSPEMTYSSSCSFGPHNEAPFLLQLMAVRRVIEDLISYALV